MSAATAEVAGCVSQSSRRRKLYGLPADAHVQPMARHGATRGGGYDLDELLGESRGQKKPQAPLAAQEEQGFGTRL